jgi:imidazole glycerol-phosphate synthase subunit HisF
MKCKRIISKLEIKGPNLVKGVNLEGMRVLGKPDQFSELYYREKIDELYYQDTVASLYGRNSLFELIEKVSKLIFIPLCVGGGVKNLKDIYNLLKVGADKVSINKQALEKPNFLYEASKKFGKANICVSIETIWINNDYYCFYDNGRNFSGVKLLDWIKKIDKIGVGEICITFVDKDGTGDGFDIETLKKIENLTNIPLIVHAGAGNKKQVYELLTKTKFDGVSISSLFHYYYIHNLIKISKKEYEDEGNIDYLKLKIRSTKIETMRISTLKKYLIKKKINCRL